MCRIDPWITPTFRGWKRGKAARTGEWREETASEEGGRATWFPRAECHPVDTRWIEEGHEVWSQTGVVQKYLWGGEVSTQCHGSTGEGLLRSGGLEENERGRGERWGQDFILDPEFEGIAGYPVYNTYKLQTSHHLLFFLAPPECWALYQAWDYRDDKDTVLPWEGLHSGRQKLHTMRSEPQGRVSNRFGEDTGNCPFQSLLTTCQPKSTNSNQTVYSVSVLLPLDLSSAPPKNVSQLWVTLQCLAHIWPPHWSFQETLSSAISPFPEQLQHFLSTHTHCLVPGACLLPYPYFPTSCACLLPPARHTSWRHVTNVSAFFMAL